MGQNIKCVKCSQPMREVLSRKGALIDICPACKGVYLDQGEINFFIQNKKLLRAYEAGGLKGASKTLFKCPKCESPMQAGRFPGLYFQVEECPSCKGLFFDSLEFNKLRGNGKNFIRPDRFTKKPSLKPAGLKLPSLALTTGVVCLSLYGLLFAVIVFLMETTHLSVPQGIFISLAFLLAQFYFAPVLLDWQLKLFGSLKWVSWQDTKNLPDFFKKSCFKLCDEHRIPLPKMGIIDDDSPQAYTYGRTPKSARLVFSKGMFKLLDEEEAEAVLAHELGHIKHWDFVIMTVIQAVPMILYIIYTHVKDQLNRQTSEKDKSKPIFAVAMVVSYLFYLISEYMVLFVSRVREYHADRFSSFATKKPNKLVTALVKIAYGLLRSPAGVEEDSNNNKADKIKSVETFNIMGLSPAGQMALAHQEENQFNPQTIQEIMRWDLWNPWAFYYELNSTHPLTAKRINALGSYALALKQEPFIRFNKQKPESYWDDFFRDLFVLSLPYILGIAGGLAGWWLGTGEQKSLPIEWTWPSGLEASFLLPVPGPGAVFAGLLGLSFGALLRLSRSYPFGPFLKYSTASLLKLIKVSPARSYPVILRGRILGRGEAGNIFSENFVLRDKTGIIYLNHEPFGLNILFALFRYKKFQGKEVIVTGWYRRSPSPYVELKTIKTADTKSRAYTYHYKLAFCLIGLIISLLYMVMV